MNGSSTTGSGKRQPQATTREEFSSPLPPSFTPREREVYAKTDLILQTIRTEDIQKAIDTALDRFRGIGNYKGNSTGHQTKFGKEAILRVNNQGWAGKRNFRVDGSEEGWSYADEVTGSVDLQEQINIESDAPAFAKVAAGILQPDAKRWNDLDVVSHGKYSTNAGRVQTGAYHMVDLLIQHHPRHHPQLIDRLLGLVCTSVKWRRSVDIRGQRDAKFSDLLLLEPRPKSRAGFRLVVQTNPDTVKQTETIKVSEFIRVDWKGILNDMPLIDTQYLFTPRSKTANKRGGRRGNKQTNSARTASGSGKSRRGKSRRETRSSDRMARNDKNVDEDGYRSLDFDASRPFLFIPDASPSVTKAPASTRSE